MYILNHVKFVTTGSLDFIDLAKGVEKKSTNNTARVHHDAFSLTVQPKLDDAEAQRFDISVRSADAGRVSVLIDGVASQLRYSRSGGAASDLWLSHGGKTWCFNDQSLAPAEGEAPGADGRISATSDGKLLALNVAEGDRVEPGQTVAVLEAMKMEFQLQTPVGGTVKAVHADAGAQVANRQLLVELELDEA